MSSVVCCQFGGGIETNSSPNQTKFKKFHLRCVQWIIVYIPEMEQQKKDMKRINLIIGDSTFKCGLIN